MTVAVVGSPDIMSLNKTHPYALIKMLASSNISFLFML